MNPNLISTIAEIFLSFLFMRATYIYLHLIVYLSIVKRYFASINKLNSPEHIEASEIWPFHFIFAYFWIWNPAVFIVDLEHVKKISEWYCKQNEN